MPRPVTLFTGQWADLSLETLAQKVSSWGFDGVELACWGDHFEIDKALESDRYVREKRDLLEKYNLKCWAISNHLVGQCICDPIDSRHKSILSPRLWGDGDPEGVRQRAAESVARDDGQVVWRPAAGLREVRCAGRVSDETGELHAVPAKRHVCRHQVVPGLRR